jgi:GATA-binding protein
MDWRAQSRSRSRSAFRGAGMYDSGTEAHAHSLLTGNDPIPAFDVNQFMTHSLPGAGQDWASLAQYGFELPPGRDDGQSETASPPDHAALAASAEQSSLAGSLPHTHLSVSYQSDTSTSADQAFRNLATEFDRSSRTAGSFDLLGSSAPNGQVPSPSKSASQDLKERYGTLPGISGAGLVSQTEENYHPQYGYLPRRVRKTSFDHSSSKDRENIRDMLPPRLANVSPSPALRLD